MPTPKPYKLLVRITYAVSVHEDVESEKNFSSDRKSFCSDDGDSGGNAIVRILQLYEIKQFIP